MLYQMTLEPKRIRDNSGKLETEVTYGNEIERFG